MSMNKQKKIKSGVTKRILSVALFALAAILLISSVAGYAIRGMEATGKNLNEMRTNAVLHAASGGLIDSIAADANAAALKELRAKPDFRSMGMDDVKAYCAEAEAAARAEAEALYSNTENADSAALVEKINAMETVMVAYSEAEAVEMKAYAELYTALYDSVADWTDFVGELDDAGIWAKVCENVPELGKAENAHYQKSLTKMVKAMAKEEKEAEDAETLEQLNSALAGLVTDWTVYAQMDDETMWAEFVALMPNLAEAETFRGDMLKSAKEKIEAAASGEVTEAAAESGETEAVVEEPAFEVDYEYFTESDALAAQGEGVDAAFSELWAVLVDVIPDLDNLDKKMQKSIRETIEGITTSSSYDFSERYDIYAAQNADQILTGSAALTMKLAASAGEILIAGIAAALIAIVYTFWKPLVKKMGVPRTIILLFFIFLCLAAQLYKMNVPMMLGNVLQRVGMYGVLVLAMLPGIQCGIGLNMGMTIGCISGLLATMIALQYNLTGVAALTFSCIGGALIAIPCGWAYSLLLNRMKGEEMTISTYVGFSFVSLMCIGWMLLPFTNTKIIWLLSGRGLRVTHSLLGNFGHLLDEAFAFKLFGATIPTGLLIFFLVCCFVMWLFSRSKLGIAMTAAGSNPRFAEASGINVNKMRTLGTILSTMIAAVGIVIYSQAFGYAQLYTAPRQLGFIAASSILIGGATVSKAKVSHAIIGVFLFEGVLALGQQIANAVVAGGGLSEVMRIMISNGIILYALTQSGGASRE